MNNIVLVDDDFEANTYPQPPENNSQWVNLHNPVSSARRNQIHPTNNNSARTTTINQHSMNQTELTEWIEEKFVGPLFKTAKDRFKTKEVLHNEGFFLGKSKWMLDGYSNFYMAAVLVTLTLRSACIGIFFLAVDPDKVNSGATLICGIFYCLFTMLRYALTLFDSCYKSCNCPKNKVLVERLVQVRDFCNLLFHLVNLLGIISLQNNPSQVSPSMISLVGLVLMILMAISGFSMHCFLEKKDTRHLFIIAENYVNITQWLSWATILGFFKFRLLLTQLGVLTICGACIMTCYLVTILAIPCMAIKEQIKPEHRPIMFLHHAFITYANLFSVMIYCADRIIEKSEIGGKEVDDLDSAKKYGGYASLATIILSVAYIIITVRFKKYDEKSPAWISEMLSIHEKKQEEQKKNKEEEAKEKEKNLTTEERERRAKQEEFRNKKSIYRIGENFYSDTKGGNEEKLKEKKTVELCQICFAVPSSCIFKPCNHGGICVSCAKEIMNKKDKTCPFCRVKVHKIVEYTQVDYDGDNKVDKYAQIKEFTP